MPKAIGKQFMCVYESVTILSTEVFVFTTDINEKSLCKR